MKKTNKIQATLIGSSAILMWAFLALLTTMAGTIPSFQLVAMAFTIAFFLAFGKWITRNENILSHLKLPAKVWALGIIGLFGYHFLYFQALANAPPVEAGLIAYLWPLLIVVFSGLLPGEQLQRTHVFGALAGLVGTYVLVTSGGRLSAFNSNFAFGYILAGLCAMTWAGYSLLSRRIGHISTDSIGGFCGATAILAWGMHFGFETTIWPSGLSSWLAVLGLGLGPVGAAFYTWDIGTKHGDIQVLGALSYAAPLLSTLILILAGKGELTWSVFSAGLLITGGALFASKNMLKRQSG